jgi:hypothetical protein
MTVVFVLGSELLELCRSYNKAMSSNFDESCNFAICNRHFSCNLTDGKARYVLRNVTIVAKENLAVRNCAGWL